ncbi:hypothetical protein CEUSTIGMA_g4195.t1 [Chlamydomonas eustigma]|uniref:Glycosyltransferase family 92 protein n=1 Tax=Chlamydomonas eustigma TaxID=1157962 RepID=A0A250X0Z8_9CHLO|nr:hypothetical protein CEUSTIGMA_g4195.t1 [Chlamydomonas eustigma]|eukprot:GAX76748.1 hypothetical protein CEUSTIGMA_g4195.t1 [Chlamydomonas eustigma]
MTAVLTTLLLVLVTSRIFQISSESRGYHLTKGVQRFPSRQRHRYLTETSARTKAAKYAHLKIQGDGPQYIDSRDMGVQSCHFIINGSLFKNFEEEGPLYRLSIYLRYTFLDSTASIKGFASAELIGQLPQGFSVGSEERIDPCIKLYTHNNASSFPVRGKVSFPTISIDVAASTHPLAASFERVGLSNAYDHVYYITSIGANSTCMFRPTMSPNVIDTRGVELKIPADNNATMANETPTHSYVVMRPFRSSSVASISSMAILLDRHIQWHQTLGFNRHVVYLRATEITEFSNQAIIKPWIDNGCLLIVLWEDFPSYDAIPNYDQRIVHSHAILAFSGHNIYLAMLALDEYLMTLRSDLETFHDMVHECSFVSEQEGDISNSKRYLHSTTEDDDIVDTGEENEGLSRSPVNIFVTRYNVLAKGFHHLKPELDVWLGQSTEVLHPLLKYTLVNKARPPPLKSVIRPEYIHTMYLHSASHYPAFSSSYPDPNCILILHLKSVFRSRSKKDITPTALKRSGYKEDKELEAALKLRAAMLLTAVPTSAAVPAAAQPQETDFSTA